MSFSKSITHCRRCVTVLPKRQINSTSSNAIDPEKMHAKSLVLNQMKLINQLKTYMAKFTSDKSFDNVLNKEFAQFLQKIQPRIYGDGLRRLFESSTTSSAVQTEDDGKNKPTGTSISIPTIINDLINIRNREVEERIEVPKWKQLAKPLISKEEVSLKTSELLLAIAMAKTGAEKLGTVEDFIQYLKEHPEVKHNAVKEGGVRMLLQLRRQTENPTIQSALSEAFALLGHVDPVPGNGIRILSIDGGGVRGILVIEMLRKLEELTGKPVNEMFDIVCGVSTGAIIATLVGLKHCTLDEVSEIYKSLSTQIFTQSTLKGTSNLVWCHSYYDTALWEKLLREQWGEKMLIETSRNPKCPKFCAVSAVVNQSRLSAYLFRNYTLPYKIQSQYLGGHNHKVWESVRASAAAPTYFEEFKVGNMLHQDGGILVNNPTAVAIHEAKLLWPDTPIQCVVSFGTGRTVPNPIELEPMNTSSWKDKFFAIIDSATDTEGVHTMLSDLLPGDTYYRFNPYLTEMLNMAEINPGKLEQLERDAVMYLRRNEDKFQAAARALSFSKGGYQKVFDWVNLQKEIHGFNLV